MVPESRSHLKTVMRKLKRFSYLEIIETPLKNSKNNEIEVTVKSYFWASRTIKNCKCLPRSIALYQRLIADDYIVEHKFGVNKKDESLVAHAWVEHNKKPLNESIDLKQRFEVMHNRD